MTDNASGQSATDKPKTNARRRNNNRRRPNNAKDANTKPSASVNNTSEGAKKSSNNRNRNRNRNRNKNNSRNNSRTQKLTGIDFISTKYLNLLDQHLQARKKFFENFSRVNDQTKRKLEKNFIESQKSFLEFKARLKPEDLALYESRYESLSNDDRYSKAHGLDFDAESVSFIMEDSYVGPHHLQTQIDSDFSADDEESVGSIDDYKAYKGISD